MAIVAAIGILLCNVDLKPIIEPGLHWIRIGSSAHSFSMHDAEVEDGLKLDLIRHCESAWAVTFVITEISLIK